MPAAHQFDYELDLRIGHNLRRVVGEHTIGKAERALLAEVAHRDSLDVEGQAGLCFDRAAIVDEPA